MQVVRGGVGRFNPGAVIGAISFNHSVGKQSLLLRNLEAERFPRMVKMPIGADLRKNNSVFIATISVVG